MCFRPSQFSIVFVLGLLSASPFGSVTGQNGRFSTLGEAARALNLTSFLQLAPKFLLDDATFQGFVFMPTDDAFGKAAGMLPLVGPTSVLSYHVVPGNASFPALNMANRTSLQSALDFPTPVATNAISVIPMNASDGAAYVGGILPGVVVSSNSSFTAAQATVYMVEDLLLPAMANSTSTGYPLTLAQAAQADPAFGILTLIVSADQEISNLLNDPTSAYTVMAPNNDAFSAALETLNMTAVELMPLLGSQLLNSVLKMHFLAGPPMLAGLVPRGSTPNVATLNPAYYLDISNDGSSITVSGPGNLVAATVVQADILAGLSVAHIVDKVLFPPLEEIRTALSALAR